MEKLNKMAPGGRAREDVVVVVVVVVVVIVVNPCTYLLIRA